MRLIRFNQLTGHILVLAEPTATVDLLVMLVSQQGYTVQPERIQPGRWHSTLDNVCSRSPDLILLELTETSYDRCQHLATDDRLQDVPIIGFCHPPQQLDLDKLYAVGASDYLSNPLHAPEVAARLHIHLALRRSRLYQQPRYLPSVQTENAVALALQEHDLKFQELSNDRAWAESLLAGQNHILSLIAGNVPLSEVLDALVLLVEELSEQSCCSCSLFDPAMNCLRHGAAPSLPEKFNQLVNGVVVGPAVGSCGAAVYYRQPVIVSDISTDLLWAEFRAIAEYYGLRACWSMPIISGTGQVLGTFAIYHRDSRVPGSKEWDLLNVASDLARMAIEHHQSVSTLQSAKEAAEVANHVKSKFLARMSHELRTPLSAIMGFTELILEDITPNSDHHNYATIILNSGKHLMALIDDALEMGKIEAGHQTFNPCKFDLQQMLDSLHDMIRLSAAAKGLQFIVDCAADVPRYVCTDKRKLYQVLLNLLSNAVKFTDRGSVTLRVNVEKGSWGVKDEDQEIRHDDSDSAFSTHHPPFSTSYALPPTLLFEVEDTGIGIFPHELELLFEPFVQTETGRKFPQGIGLGLPISREFVELMGGSIQVQSVPDQGTVFRVAIQTQPIVSHASEVAMSLFGSSEQGIAAEFLDINVLNSVLGPTIDPIELDFSQMSPAWVKAVHQAACQADEELLLQLIAEIPNPSSSLAITMLDLVAKLRIDLLITLTKAYAIL